MDDELKSVVLLQYLTDYTRNRVDNQQFMSAADGFNHVFSVLNELVKDIDIPEDIVKAVEKEMVDRGLWNDNVEAQEEEPEKNTDNIPE